MTKLPRRWRDNSIVIDEQGVTWLTNGKAAVRYTTDETPCLPPYYIKPSDVVINTPKIKGDDNLCWLDGSTTDKRGKVNYEDLGAKGPSNIGFNMNLLKEACKVAGVPVPKQLRLVFVNGEIPAVMSDDVLLAGVEKRG